MIMSDIMSRRIWKAVSPLIATIILIAVTIAIAAIVIAWVYGIFGTATGPGEKLQIFADARLITTTDSTTFTVTVKNIGTSVVTIQKVYIKEKADECTNSTTNQLTSGEVKIISAEFTCSLQPGITYTAVIVTGGGQAYNVPVTAEQG
jgi:flagellin-like protein